MIVICEKRNVMAIPERGVKSAISTTLKSLTRENSDWWQVHRETRSSRTHVPSKYPLDRPTRGPRAQGWGPDKTAILHDIRRPEEDRESYAARSLKLAGSALKSLRGLDS